LGGVRNEALAKEMPCFRGRRQFTPDSYSRGAEQLFIPRDNVAGSETALQPVVILSAAKDLCRWSAAPILPANT
jgi:hypothetical protein